MKQLILFLSILLIAIAQCLASENPTELERTRAEVRAAIDAAEIVMLKQQSVEELNNAAQAQIVKELKLSGSKLKEFNVLYKSYREALDKAIVLINETGTDEKASQQQLKDKLANISATAQVKREYIDRFAEILTAAQIRMLYNTEGQIATSIKSAANRYTSKRLHGSGRMVTQDFGVVGDYTTLNASCFVKITTSATARTVSVTADDNVIDFVEMTNDAGILNFRINASQIENISVSVVVPVSAKLATIVASSYASIKCATPLRIASPKISVSSYGSVVAEIENAEKATIQVSSYAKFIGGVSAKSVSYSLSSYASAQGAIVCSDQCNLSLGSYAKFADPVKADALNLQVSSYAKFDGNVAVRQLALSVGSYAVFSGTIEASEATLSVSSGGKIGGSFAASSLKATVGSYAKMSLSGTAKINTANVEVAANGSFSAPQLQVTNYVLKASSYAKASVWCSGVLHISAATSAAVDYDGPCRVEASTPNLQRRK